MHQTVVLDCVIVIVMVIGTGGVVRPTAALQLTVTVCSVTAAGRKVSVAVGRKVKGHEKDGRVGIKTKSVGVSSPIGHEETRIRRRRGRKTGMQVGMERTLVAAARRLLAVASVVSVAVAGRLRQMLTRLLLLVILQLLLPPLPLQHLLLLPSLAWSRLGLQVPTTRQVGGDSVVGIVTGG